MKHARLVAIAQVRLRSLLLFAGVGLATLAHGQDRVRAGGDSGDEVTSPGRAATRSLPAGKTLACIEVGSVAHFEEAGAALPILSLWKHPKVRGFLDYMSSVSSESKAQFGAYGRAYDWARGFDAGLAGSIVFAPGRSGRPRPAFCVTGAARDAETLRNAEDDFVALMATSRQARGLTPLDKTQVPLTDSPLSATKLAARAEEVNSGWSYRRSAFLLRKGRTVGTQFVVDYGEASKGTTMDRAIATALGDLVYVRRDATDLLRFGPTPPLREGETVLARAVLRMDENLTSKEHGVRERELPEVEAAGFLGWDGLASVLVRQSDGTLREVVDSYDSRVKADSAFRALRGNGKGLGDQADFVPADAFAAMRIVMDEAITTRWMRNMGEAFRAKDDMDGFLRGMRSTLGLQPNDAEKGFEGLGEITVAIVPPAPGVLAPELCLVLPGTGDKDAPARILASFVSFAAQLGMQLETKTLGKGEDAIPYLDLKGLFNGGGNRPNSEETMVAKALLGGGFLSATAVGDKLLVGCNPRTLRKWKRAVLAGQTLAGRDGFLAKFPKGSDCFFEAWFDWKKIVASLRVADTVLPYFISMRAAVLHPVNEDAVAVGGAAPGERAQDEKGAAAKPKLTLPTTTDIAELVDEQYIRGRVEPFGHRFELEGSMVASPTAIWAFLYVAIWLDDFESLLRV